MLQLIATAASCSAVALSLQLEEEDQRLFQDQSSHYQLGSPSRPGVCYENEGLSKPAITDKDRE